MKKPALFWMSVVLWLSACGSPSGRPSEEAPRAAGAWVRVGMAAPLPPSEQEASSGEPRELTLRRASAERAWREAPGQKQALELARTYFPEFSSAEESDGARQAPAAVAGDAALRVRLPGSEGDALELTTWGRVFRVKQPGRVGPWARRLAGSAAFYGERHFWTAVGGRTVDASGQWVTSRVEEYDIAEEGASEHVARYEVSVPEGVVAVRDAGEYLEFLDTRGVPQLRLHYLMARDAEGASRWGEVRLRGVARDEGQGAGPVRYTLSGPVLDVEMRVDLGGLKGTVVVDPGWSSTNLMALARREHTATVLLSGKVLVTGGYTTTSNTSATRSAELYDPDTGTWKAVNNMADARAQHTGTLLPSGKVLVAGGSNGSAALVTAEWFDPETESWSNTDMMKVARYSHVATVLLSGKVLVTGGATSQTSAELFDPLTGSWSLAASMLVARVGHTATLLGSGRVLVTGGTLASTAVELYDPDAGTWSQAGNLLTARLASTATLLPSGLVLIAGGGATNSVFNTAELYNPVSRTSSATGLMTSSHRGHTATLLASGRVLVAGGNGSFNSYWGVLDTTQAASVYDPSRGTWSAAAAIPGSSRIQHTASVLPSGRVLLVGGLSVLGNAQTIFRLAELFEPTEGAWRDAVPLGTARSGHTTTLLPTGKLLVTGGQGGGGPLATAEVQDPVSGLWSPAGTMLMPRSGHTATLLPTGKVLVVGGSSSDTAELYDPFSQGWSSAGRMATARTGHTATLLPSGRVLVLGGASGGAAVASAEVFDPRSGLWTSVRPMSTGRERHAAVLLPSGRVLVTGGINGNTPLGTAEIYDPATDTWGTPLTMNTARVDATLTLLSSGRVLLVGGFDASGPLATAELFNPANSTWSTAGRLTVGRSGHTATLLPWGEVLVVGGSTSSGSFANSSERYEPFSNSWDTLAPMGVPRVAHTATLSPSGEVVIVGGRNAVAVASVEQFAPASATGTGRPTLDSPQVVQPGAPFTVTGSGFRGVSEGGGGTTSSSTGNTPQLRFWNIASGALASLPRVESWSPVGTQLTARAPTLAPGQYLLLLTVNGVTGGRVVRVTDSNAAPVARDLARGTPKNTPLALALQVTDADSDDLTYAVVQAPRRGTLSGAGVNLVYTPQPGYSGADSFTYRASDGVAESNIATVSLTVTNNAPVALSTVVTTSKGRAVQMTLMGLDADNDALTFQVMSVPSRGTLSGTAPVLTYTPDTGYAGNDTFTFRVNDGTTDSRTVAVTLRVLNLAPVAYPGAITVATGRNVPVTLDATDADGDLLTYTVVQAPLHGTLSGTAPHLVYTPEPGYVGADSFTFRARDGAADSNVGALSITVTERPANAPPSVPVPTSPANGSTVSGTVTLTWQGSTDPEGDAVTYRVELLRDGEWLASLSTPSASLVLPGMLLSGQYVWRVEAVDARGNHSGLSAPAGFSVTSSLMSALGVGRMKPDEEPEPPSEVACSAGGSGGWSVWAGVMAVLALGLRRRRRAGP
jgi:N-acetylneuraminic acid mutarotase